LCNLFFWINLRFCYNFIVEKDSSLIVLLEEKTMRAKASWTIQSFLVCFFFNALLVGAIFLMAREILWGMHYQYVDPLLGTHAEKLPEHASSALKNLKEFIRQTEYYLPYVLSVLGGGFTFLLWLVIQFEGRRLIRRVQKEATVIPSAPSPEVSLEKPKEKEEPSALQPQLRYAQPTPGAAIQMLSLLQRQGRFIDFLQEDLSFYDDAQVGAAVRNIHEGCKATIAEHIELKPIFKEEEGTEVNVASGFDANTIRLTGNVTGDPPFRGVLRHRGWRVERIELPQSTFDQKENWILAPAEVELEG
jgi:hypothetical protein